MGTSGGLKVAGEGSREGQMDRVWGAAVTSRYHRALLQRSGDKWPSTSRRKRWMDRRAGGRDAQGTGEDGGERGGRARTTQAQSNAWLA